MRTFPAKANATAIASVGGVAEERNVLALSLERCAPSGRPARPEGAYPVACVGWGVPRPVFSCSCRWGKSLAGVGLLAKVRARAHRTARSSTMRLRHRRGALPVRTPHLPCKRGGGSHAPAQDVMLLWSRYISKVFFSAERGLSAEKKTLLMLRPPF